MSVDPGAVSGAKMLHKSIRILRMIARRGVDGLRLSDIIQASGLPRPTVHRILKGLVENEMVVRDPETRRYKLGPLNYELGLATPIKFTIPTVLHDAFKQIAQQSGEHTYLMRRSGMEYVCVGLQEGKRELGSVTMAVGDRRPLCLGAPGQSILSTLPEDELARVLEYLDEEIRNHKRLTHDKIYKQLEFTREHGYTIGHDVSVVGIASIAIALPQVDQRAMSLCIGVPSRFMTKARRAELYGIIQDRLTAAGLMSAAAADIN